MYDELMTGKDIAEYLKVSLRTGDNLVHIFIREKLGKLRKTKEIHNREIACFLCF